jgi:hypothetical protein
MRLLLAAFALLPFLVVALIARPAGAAVPFDTVMKQPDGGPLKEAELVIQTAEDWKQFIASCQTPALRAKLSALKPDFTKETIVAVAFGPENSSLTSTEWDQAGIQKITASDGKVIIDYSRIRSDERVEAPLYPFHVVKFPKAKDFTFRKSTKDIGG